MKYKTMKEKLYAFDLQLFAEGGEGSDGDDSGDGDGTGDDGADDDAEDDADEPKYTEADMEAAVKKRLARERRKWQRQQAKNRSNSDPDGGDDAGDGNGTTHKTDADKEKVAGLEIKLACYEQGVAKDSVDDVAALAKAYMAADEELDLEDAIEKVVKKYPQFRKGAAEPDDSTDAQGKSWGQRQKGKSKNLSGVEAALLKKNPGLKID